MTEERIKRQARLNGRVPVHRSSPSHSKLRKLCKELIIAGFFDRREVRGNTIYYYPADGSKN